MFPSIMAILSFGKNALFLSILLQKHFRISQKRNHFSGFQKFHSLRQKSDLDSHILIFHAEKALLRSSSLFPYFMLVGFEAGGIIRAFILFILYPLIALCRDSTALRIMVMVSFIGLKKDRFVEGRAVLPKFFLEDVGMESFEVLRRGRVKVAISDLPHVMVESFLKDYLEVDVVVGRDLKVFCGYFVGLMEERRDSNGVHEAVKMSGGDVVGVGCFRKCFDSEWLSNCKEIYMVSEQERRNWHQLPENLYPKPLIFHDGRLAFRPTYLATLAMFMWLPMGFTLGIIRTIVALSTIFPYELKVIILHSLGGQLKTLKPENFENPSKDRKGVLYVCNHRTLLDPLILSYCLRAAPTLSVVVYSLSRASEILSPIKTVRLTRDREQDLKLMHDLLSQGNLVVCPEGTTCREPYLLRFSPLFTEITENVFPVAIDCQVSMFHGTTAGGLKCLDPLFFLMNPWPSYSVRFLNAVCLGGDVSSGGVLETSKYEKANLVQSLIARELGFTCTRLTRKDKYLILAGNEGFVGRKSN